MRDFTIQKTEGKVSPVQRKAIEHASGPVQVLAGPGSGKTFLMIRRVRHLICHHGISPDKILVITFARAAALEMQERFQKLTEGAYPSVCFGTFHAVYYHILKSGNGKTDYTPISSKEKTEYLKHSLAVCGLTDIAKDTLEKLSEKISKAKNSIALAGKESFPVVSAYGKETEEDAIEEYFPAILKEYGRIMEENRKLDFDDMMVYCYELLKERQDILEILQKRYAYILVDEFQDINKIQYEITKMLAQPCRNLFIVGDDDQSIYGFRGARPEIMLHFKEDYPEAVETLLDVNYRCNRNITEGAVNLITNNQIRFHKKIVSAKEYEEPVFVHHMKTLSEEINHVLKTIRDYHKEKLPYSEMAVILRTNVQARGIVNKLMEYNIPFQMRDRVPCIYDHFTVQNVLDYIRAAMGSRDRALFLRIMNKPNRYLSRELLTEPVVSFEALRVMVEGKNWALDNIDQFEYELKILAGLKPFAAVNFIRKAIGYDEYLREYAQYRHLNAEDLFGTLDELQEMAKQYRTFEDWFEGIDQYRKDLERHSRADMAERRDGVVVTTMHSAKGLEFDAVFILEANEGMTPYKKALKPEEIEEERRMFYVAMTRARSHLHIYEVKEYYNKELEPSRFLEEIRKADGEG